MKIRALLIFLVLAPYAQAGLPKPLELDDLPHSRKSDGDFVYAHQTAAWVFFEANRNQVLSQYGDTLKALDLELAQFRGSDAAYIVVKPMVFLATFGLQTKDIPGTSSTTEVEITVLVKPKGMKAPSLSFREFLRGQRPSNPIGQLRLDVLADNEIAVSAGRVRFGEHKFLASFEYEHTSENNSAGKLKTFFMEMSAYTWQGAGTWDRRMFTLQFSVDLDQGTKASLTPETLFSSIPPEPILGAKNTTLGEYRYYQRRGFRVFEDAKATLHFGPALGGTPLKPAPPFGDGKAIPGSQDWSKQMVNKLRGALRGSRSAGIMIYRTEPAEFETKPFRIN